MRVILLLCLLWVAGNTYAEGLPANPWQNPPTVNIPASNENVGSSDKTADFVDIWNKVRSSENIRQWHMPVQQTDNSAEKDKSIFEKQTEMLSLLNKLNYVGYKMPKDYQNFVKKMPQKTNTSKQYSYDRTLTEWKTKYNGMKNSSLNILDNSYRRMLSTVKNATGVDINRAVNDSINAFK